MSRFISVIKQTSGRLDRIISLILVVAILVAIGAVVYVAMNWGTGEKFSEFYLLGPEGKAEGYPEALAVGEEGEVVLGIVNHEQETMSYKVSVKIGEILVEEIGPIALAHEQKWEQDVKFVLQEPGDNQKVEFKLFKIHQLGEKGETLLSLWLGREYLDAVVSNQGLDETNYRMEVLVEGNETQGTRMESIGPETLTAGNMWNVQLYYKNEGNQTQKAELLLYRDESIVYEEKTMGDYPTLHFWINVE